MSLSNPFTPGFGSVPPHMAGRDPEHKLLKDALAAITGPRQDKYGPLRDDPSPILKIVGPRGVGKTALQTWAGFEADALKVDVDVENLAWLPKGMAEDEISGLLGRMATIQGLSLKQLEAQAYKYFQLTRNPRAGPLSMHDFKNILEARLRFRPLLLLMDEVMHYDVELLGQMLHHTQVLIDEGWPLAVVLAGIPTLDAHLDKVNARFVYRTKDIYINRLDPAATRATMSRPFTDRGIAVSDEALELMASWSDNYSYFTQVVGKQVWDAKEKAGCAEIDVALVQGVEQKVWEQRLSIYESIYSWLDDGDELLEHAMKTVEAIEAASQPLTPEQVGACMAEGTYLDEQRTLEIYNQLLHAGLIWADGDSRVHATLPSFFNYFKEEYKRDHLRSRQAQFVKLKQ